MVYIYDNNLSNFQQCIVPHTNIIYCLYIYIQYYIVVYNIYFYIKRISNLIQMLPIILDVNDHTFLFTDSENYINVCCFMK